MHGSLALVILFIHEPKLTTQTSNPKLLILTHLYHINSNDVDLFLHQGERERTETKVKAMLIFKCFAAEHGAAVHSWCASLHASYWCRELREHTVPVRAPLYLHKDVHILVCSDVTVSVRSYAFTRYLYQWKSSRQQRHHTLRPQKQISLGSFSHTFPCEHSFNRATCSRTGELKTAIKK